MLQMNYGFPTNAISLEWYAYPKINYIIGVTMNVVVASAYLREYNID